MTRVDILSDPICPWCFIGKTQLDRALKAAPLSPFDIEWHPFQLNPDMPPEGMDRRDYLEAKFGGKEQAVQVYAQIAEHAEGIGLDLDLGAITRTPNTLDAHRLIHWAGLERKQGAVVDALFSAYFQEGRDIGDRATLSEIAGRVGLDAEVIARTLETDNDAEDIRRRDSHARARGVTGVPTFIVAEHHVVAGAQPPELWAQVIEELTGPSGTA